MKIIITLISIIVVAFVIGSKINQSISTTYKITFNSRGNNLLGPIMGGGLFLVFIVIAIFHSEPESKSITSHKESGPSVIVRSLGGEKYKTVLAGGLIWLAEDLRLKTIDSWCYNNGNSCKSRLYTKAAAAQACWSIGYRLPTEPEWKSIAEKLFDRLDYRPSGFSSTYSYNVLLKKGRRIFNAQLNGKAAIFDNNLIEFSQRGKQGYYWSESASETEEYTGSFVVFDKAAATMIPNIDNSALALSCRCVKD